MIGSPFNDIERRTNGGAYIRQQVFKNIDVPGYRGPRPNQENGRDKPGH
jgi:hypothetical protein